MSKWEWTRIADTELFEAARYEMSINANNHKLRYHNIDHVQAMYKHLELSKEPYDEKLDWAVIFHDLVYDDKPHKELRSGIRFLELSLCCSGCTLSYDDKVSVVSMILDTEKHENVHNPLVRADLHHLADPLRTFKSFNAIMLESMNLYGITEQQFAENSERFMKGLHARVDNAFAGNAKPRLWVAILNGIASAARLAQIVQGK